MTTYVWFVRGATHAAMCRTSMEAARRIMGKDDRCMIVSDEEPPPIDDIHTDGYQFLHIPGGNPIMVANIDAQLTALLEADDDVCFLDTDVLLLKPITLLGELTVTWRDHVLIGEEGEKVEGLAASMPYNYGVMRAKCTKATVEAFMWMRERVRKMQRNQQQWYGNQLALHELAGPRPSAGVFIDQRRIPWQLANPSTLISVGKIPCEIYNYTPKSDTDPCLYDKHALHFKGQSRPLMEGYAKALGLGWYQ